MSKMMEGSANDMSEEELNQMMKKYGGDTSEGEAPVIDDSEGY